MTRRLHAWGSGVAVAWGVLATANDARAQEETATPSEERPAEAKGFMATSHAGADLFWYSAKVLGSTFALVPSASIGVTDKVFIDVWLPIALNVGNGSGRTFFGLGNPTVGAHYAATSGTTTFHVGARASIPLVHAQDDRDARAAASTAGIATTIYDNHLWVGLLPFGAFVGVEHVAAEIIHLRGELAPTLHVPLESRDETDLQYQARGEVEARSTSGFGGGLGLQAVHILTSSGDNAQTAGEPFLGFDNRSIYARLGVLVAFDDPLGFGFDSGLLKVATARFRIGAYW